MFSARLAPRPQTCPSLDRIVELIGLTDRLKGFQVPGCCQAVSKWLLAVQREVQRLQQQLQAMTVMLDSSRAAEVEARGHAGKLEEDLEAQGAICQELQDQVANSNISSSVSQ